MKQIYQLNVIDLKIPTGGKQTSWLFTNMTDWRRIKLGSTKKQLQLSGQSETYTRDLWISGPPPKPLGPAVSDVSK